MNEQMKKLIAAAGVPAPALRVERTDLGQHVVHVTYTMSQEDLEILLGTVVQECLDIVNRKEYSYHESDPLWETAQLIKEHFAIE